MRIAEADIEGEKLRAAVDAGDVSTERIDDAVSAGCCGASFARSVRRTRRPTELR
jgi:hypothetical protein